MVRLRSGLAAGEDEALQASDEGDSMGQPPVVPNDQERVAAVNNDVELSQIGGQQRSHHHRSPERNTTRLRGDTFSYVGDKTEDATHFDLEIQDLKARVDDIMQAMKGKGQAAVNDMVHKTILAFSPAVMSYPLLSKFKMPTLESFDGTWDPLDHLETYKALMYLQAVPDEIMCRAFPTTLKGWARLWFNKLKPGSIENFEELSKQFIGHVIAGQRHRKPATHLLNVKQQNGEPLRDYISRFNTEMLQVEEVDDKVALTAFIGGLQTSKFLFSFSNEAPTSMIELMVRARKHMNAEDTMNARKNKDGEDKKSDKKRPAPSTKEERESKYKKFSNSQANRSSRRPVSPGRYNNDTPLNTSVEQVFLQIQDDTSLNWPLKLKADPTKRKRGSNPVREGRDDRPPQHQPMGEIRVISGGFAGGGETSSAWKAHARRIRSFSEVNEVRVTSPLTKLPRVEESVITFSKEDDMGIHQPHNEPLVVSMVVANFTVRRILIDKGSSADILFIGGVRQIKYWLREAPTHEVTIGGIFRRQSISTGGSYPFSHCRSQSKAGHYNGGLCSGGLPIIIQYYPGEDNIECHESNHFHLPSPDAFPN
ncbi:uncharacterized protein LOC132314203 [Cornus florida]|uniref:uncharacterized protein LOC132314203 n=1 Tax=Cornus florida TaxID=4283 RepID=UPI0028999E32|nr:uncharacterized protein LOC132314203 [Cornus florida]